MGHYPPPGQARFPAFGTLPGFCRAKDINRLTECPGNASAASEKYAGSFIVFCGTAVSSDELRPVIHAITGSFRRMSRFAEHPYKDNIMNKPTHEEISHRAHSIWQECGRPLGGADAHWLEAEKQLDAGAPESSSHPGAAEHATHHTLSDSQSAVATAERATQQKKEARGPKRPTHTGPKPTPPESGKPLWNQPHSS